MKHASVSSVVHGDGKRRWHVHKSCSTMASWPRFVIRYWTEYRSIARPNQVAAFHEAIEGYADIQFANIAPEATGTS